MLKIVLYLISGLMAGSLSGMIGVGGGIVVVPILTLIFGFSQHLAQGTTLAMLIPPIGILAFIAYYKEGYVNIPVAVCLCVGFVLGSYFGAKLAVGVSELILRRIFGVCLLVISLYTIFK
ncbi:MAG: sulfite exporter TauE/SafE family protein [Candidatus Auribacterota bacterium]|jgi:uncharacterized membrane protein YfcA|nr:sulfite exporter TauE/SafE family protein [Candidatus Auribacterota bacterium]